MTPGRDFYGPEGPYKNFAGRDASRALALMSLKVEDAENPSLARPASMCLYVSVCVRARARVVWDFTRVLESIGSRTRWGKMRRCFHHKGSKMKPVDGEPMFSFCCVPLGSLLVGGPHSGPAEDARGLGEEVQDEVRNHGDNRKI